MSCYILGIESFIPERRLTNEELVEQNPGWDAAKIYRKTGIRSRAIAPPDQTATDLGYFAAENLLRRLDVPREEVDALLFCTQSPDYFLPTSACLLQSRLGLPDTCGALDFNLGCSGFTYGLWIGRSLIDSGAADNVLLVVGETYSRYCDPHDLGTVTIFGDAGAAALLSCRSDSALATVLDTVVGTDGRGAENLIVREGCARSRRTGSEGPYLAMNGPEIFSFTLSSVRASVRLLLQKTGLGPDDIDLFLFHQANGFMLEQLRATMGIDRAKMPIEMQEIGNTVSASIPILICRCLDKGLIKRNDKCVLAGFGVGYSWATTLLEWEK